MQPINYHFILTSGRSGSNYLINTLNLHPRILNFGEVLGEWTYPFKLYRMISWSGISWNRFIWLIYRNNLFYYKAQAISAWAHLKRRQKINFKPRHRLCSIGIKDFAFLLKKRNLSEFLRLSKDIRVIHLYRNNIFKRYLSVLRLNQTGIARSVTPIPFDSVYVDTKELIATLELYEKEKLTEESIKNGIPERRVLSICYEDYFQSGQSISRTNRKIFEFLDADPIPVTSGIKKLGSDNLQTYITNYDEVRRVLSGTKFEPFLYC